MRKHDVRKWLHAILDLLPVILIPVFMIYSHRHEINDDSIQVPQKEVIEFNQLNDGYDTVSKYLGSGFIFSKSYLDNGCKYTCSTSDSTGTKQVYYRDSNTNLDMVLNHTYVSRFYVLTNVSNTYNCRVYPYQLINNVVILADIPSQINVRFKVTGDFTVEVGSVFDFAVDEGFYIQLYEFQLFDLTLMFGEGNEPTLDNFNQIFTDDYYDYTLSKKILINNGYITYNDTDIMSQMTYQLYNSVDKYFNMGNVFNLGDVYDWFNLNIFNGNAPISVYIVYQIVLYEFVMDLLFLLYALFMWFIDMIEKLMEKPLNSVR